MFLKAPVADGLRDNGKASLPDGDSSAESSLFLLSERDRAVKNFFIL